MLRMKRGLETEEFGLPRAEGCPCRGIEAKSCLFWPTFLDAHPAFGTQAKPIAHEDKIRCVADTTVLIGCERSFVGRSERTAGQASSGTPRRLICGRNEFLELEQFHASTRTPR
jgi:hypothetical protein